MADDQFEIEEKSAAHWRVVFSNPPVNLITPETILQFQALVERIETNPTLQVIVLESGNADFFFGRYDLARAEETPVSMRPSGLPTWVDMTTRLSRAPTVTIAKVRWRTRAGGSELVMAMDMPFASLERAVFGHAEV